MASVLGWLLTQQQETQQRLEFTHQQSRKILAAIIDRILITNKIILEETERTRLDHLIKAVCDGDDNAQDCDRLGQTISQTLQQRQHALNLLTEREREILTFMAQKNLSYRAIAQKLHVSEGTIRAHASNIMQKAHVHSRQDAVIWAQSWHLLPINGPLREKISQHHYETE